MNLFFVLAVLVAAALADDSYVVVAPSKVRPGMQFSVSVNILKATGDVGVTASMVRTADKSTVASSTATLQAGTPSSIDLQIPKQLAAGSYELHVAGTGGLVFSNHTRITLSTKAMSVLVQTDKAMYKPGQTVNFRVMAVYPDLSLYTGNFDIEIYDASSNKIKQWKGLSAGNGVITHLLSLSSQTVLGDWKIKVTAGNDVEEKVFTVAEYVLPKFEVKVELPSYVLDSASGVPVTVKTNYTYGKPVDGTVVVEAKENNRFYHGTLPTVERTGQLDQGKVVITFPFAELRQINRYLNGHKLTFTAKVTETLTRITLNGSSTVQVYNKAVKLEFPSSNPKNFKPGLDYNGYLKVSQPDGRPVTSTAGQSVTISTTVTAELPAPNPTPFYYYPRTSSYQLPKQTLALTSNGLIPLQLTIPSNATSINVHAEYSGVSAYSSITKSYSPSNSYIQLFLRSSNQLQAGGRAIFEYRATEGVHTLVYQILSRGSIVSTGKVMGGSARSKMFSLTLEPSMAPNARIVVYYVRPDGEIVTDSISFDVAGAFQNQVSVAIDKSMAKPAENVQVTVNASPESTAYLLAVDQSVLLLKSGNDITSGQVIDELKSYDTTSVGRDDHFPGPIPLGGARFRLKRMIRFPYPIFYGGSDANQIFQNAGVVVMTDALVYKYVKPYQGCPMCEMALGGGGGGGGGGGWAAGGMLPSVGGTGLQEVEHVRSVFPETWLWTNATTSTNGSATMTTTVPDTITSWVATAFAVNNNTGLGIAPLPANIKVFKNFFVSLNLPYSVIRGEQVVLEAIVFNYLTTSQEVRVSMAQSNDFYNLVFDANGQETMTRGDQFKTVTVPAGAGKTVSFPIVPTTLGNVELILSAQSTQAADSVRRNLLVEAEGVPKEFSVSVLVDLKNTTSFTKTVPISLPTNVVADSASARVTAIGDLMGPTVSGLDKLLKLPTGCGEQTMLYMAPDIFVSDYLKATNQLTGDIRQKAIGFMEKGYQRELTYQHKDGSFSAFGDRDPSGSMWLTAFVVKSFKKAQPYITIDEKVIDRAVNWIVTKQRSDGSFPEPGRVIHKNMQGGASNGTALTAFVLISLVENSDLQGSIGDSVNAAKARAIAHLKQKLPQISDDYILAMTTYALALAKDPSAAQAFTTLRSHATTEGGMRYWHKAKPQTTTSTNHWRRPQAASSDVEMTAYALLTYAVMNDLLGGLDVLKWLATQRNPDGGFSSTQDTVLAVQAMSEFARLTYSSDFDVSVSVTADPAFSKDFRITASNSLVLQSADFLSVPTSVTVKGTGSGVALVETAVFFNVEAEVEEPTFEIKVALIQDTPIAFEIETCVKWLAPGTSGMSVMEVGIPTGFSPDVDSIKAPKLMKRIELQDRKAILYFDEIGTAPVCTRLTSHRSQLVGGVKPVAVRIFDYYEPENQATVFYLPQSLKNSSVCSAGCADCGCPAPRRG